MVVEVTVGATKAASAASCCCLRLLFVCLSVSGVIQSSAQEQRPSAPVCPGCSRNLGSALPSPNTSASPFTVLGFGRHHPATFAPGCSLALATQFAAPPRSFSSFSHLLRATDDTSLPSRRGSVATIWKGAQPSFLRSQVQVLDADFERLSMTVSDGFHSVAALLEPDALQHFVDANPQTPPAHLKGSLVQCTVAHFEVLEGVSGVMLRIGFCPGPSAPLPPPPLRSKRPAPPPRALRRAGRIPCQLLSQLSVRDVSGVCVNARRYQHYPGCIRQRHKPSAAPDFGTNADGTRSWKVLVARAEPV